MSTQLEVLTVGRVGVDLYPEQSGVPLSEVTTFARSLGGIATNVAVGAARLGRASGVLTKTGDDDFGVYVRQALAVAMHHVFVGLVVVAAVIALGVAAMPRRTRTLDGEEVLEQ